MPVDPSLYDKTISSIRKKYGNESVRKGNEYDNPWRIPTGSYELDYATGGGIPIGRWARFFGHASSGKSLAGWNIIRNAQNIHHVMKEKTELEAQFLESIGWKKEAKTLRAELKEFLARFPDGMTCVYYNIEKQYHKDFVASRGVDVDKLIVMEGTIIEEVGDKLTAMMPAAHVHVLDSCSAGVPNFVMENDVLKETRGLEARTWNRMFKKAFEFFDHEENVVVQIDQVRVKQGQQQGAEIEEPPGGKMMEHKSDMTIQFKRNSWLYRANGTLTDDIKKAGTIKTLSGYREPDGIEMQARVVKSRVGRPFRAARMRMDYADMGYDTEYELMKAAKHYGVVRQAGSWIYLLDEDSKDVGDEVGVHKWQGARKFQASLKQMPELRQRIVRVWQKAVEEGEKAAPFDEELTPEDDE